MKGYIAICKAFRLPRIIKRVVVYASAIYGNENVFALGSSNKAHMLPKPALQPPPLVVIGSGALRGILLAALEAVHVKLPHISPDLLKALHKLAV